MYTHNFAKTSLNCKIGMHVLYVYPSSKVLKKVLKYYVWINLFYAMSLRSQCLYIKAAMSHSFSYGTFKLIVSESCAHCTLSSLGFNIFILPNLSKIISQNSRSCGPWTLVSCPTQTLANAQSKVLFTFHPSKPPIIFVIPPWPKLVPRGHGVSDEWIWLSGEYTRMTRRKVFLQFTQSLHWWSNGLHQIHLQTKSSWRPEKFYTSSLLAWAIFKSRNMLQVHWLLFHQHALQLRHFLACYHLWYIFHIEFFVQLVLCYTKLAHCPIGNAYQSSHTFFLPWLNP